MKNDGYFHADTLPNKEPIYLQLKNNACIQYTDVLRFEGKIIQGFMNNRKINLSEEEQDSIINFVFSEFQDFCLNALTINDFKPADLEKEIKDNDK